MNRSGVTAIVLTVAIPGVVLEGAEAPNLITFSQIDKAWAVSDGRGTLVAVLDWQFDLKGEEASKYVHPTSLVPGEAIGELEPWHGEWMAEIIHRVAPAAKIIPIKAKGLGSRDYEDHLIEGIRLAADLGAVAVTNSMGPVNDSEALRAAIDYAEQRGTIFVNVHPEYVVEEHGKRRQCVVGECDARILHSGLVSVPDHPTEPQANRNLYVWPYDLDMNYQDGWGYSNGPPAVGGVIALMRGVSPDLTPETVREILGETVRVHDGFAVLDAEAAVQAAIGER